MEGKSAPSILLLCTARRPRSGLKKEQSKRRKTLQLPKKNPPSILQSSPPSFELTHKKCISLKTTMMLSEEVLSHPIHHNPRSQRSTRIYTSPAVTAYNSLDNYDTVALILLLLVVCYLRRSSFSEISAHLSVRCCDQICVPQVSKVQTCVTGCSQIDTLWTR